MIEQLVKVIAVEEQALVVKPEAASQCAPCAGGQGCGALRLAEMFGVRPRQFRIKNPGNISPGDELLLGMKEEDLVSSASWLYMLPLGLLLAGAILGQLISRYSNIAHEGLVIAFAVAGFYIGFRLLKKGGLPGVRKGAEPVIIEVKSTQQAIDNVPVNFSDRP